MDITGFLLSSRGLALLAWITSVGLLVFASRPWAFLAVPLFVAASIVFVRERFRTATSAIEKFARGRGYDFVPELANDLAARVNDSGTIPVFSPGSLHNVVQGRFEQLPGRPAFQLGHFSTLGSGGALSVTVCMLDLGVAGAAFDGVFLCEKADSDSDIRGTRGVELESIEFSSMYSLSIADDVEPVSAQRLFGPSTIEWFARKPAVNVAIRGGLLVTSVRGAVGDRPTMEKLIEAARRVARSAVSEDSLKV